MKKLLGIVVLGLLLSGNVFAESEKKLKKKRELGVPTIDIKTIRIKELTKHFY